MRLVPQYFYDLCSTRLHRLSLGRPRSFSKKLRMVQVCTLFVFPHVIQLAHCYGAPACRSLCYCELVSSSSWPRGCSGCRCCWGRARLACYSMAPGSPRLIYPLCSPDWSVTRLTSTPPF